MKWAWAGVLALGLAAWATEPGQGTLEVELVGVRTGGLVWVSLFDDPKAFPGKRDRSVQRINVEPDGGVLRVRFTGLAERDYAVGVVHDKNGDGVVATGLFGIPTEGIGVSRDAPAFFGPPKFGPASVHLDAGATLPLVIHVQY